jgi:PHD/YefM family antitoxin component YafN of YafNO toxin-antitoxin module
MDESQLAAGYADVLNQVAADQRPVILQRDGADVAAVVPVEFLEIVRDALARQESERVAAEIDWGPRSAHSAPPQYWFDGEEPKPF